MADTVIEWTYAGRTFGITVDPADIDEALSMITRVGDDDDFSLGLARMIERGQHARKKTGKVLGFALLSYACDLPEPHGSRCLQLAKEGGVTFAFELHKEGSRAGFRMALYRDDATIH